MLDEDEWKWNRLPPDDALFYKVFGHPGGERLVDRWYKDDPVLHIELRKWADVLVIAPLTVNTLAKMAHGICDNLLTSVFRAWEPGLPVVIAPAANTMMWEAGSGGLVGRHRSNSLAGEQISMLRGYHDLTVVGPVAKELACRETGMGAMADIADVVAEVDKACRWLFPIAREDRIALTDPDFPNDFPPGVPVGEHPGAFGVTRRGHRHTGVDLYTKPGMAVHAVESGVVVGIEQFTGARDGSPWYEDTWCVLVEGRSGVVCYGEVNDPGVFAWVGEKVRRGDRIGSVTPVLPKGRWRDYVPGHSRAMLHVELYDKGRDKASTSWLASEEKHPYLQDPTPYLLAAVGAPGGLKAAPGDKK
jgi:hypothetical protein